MRYAIVGAGNDHRLGGHEAPPAIISLYLGDELEALVDAVIKGHKPPPTVDRNVDLGVPYLPKHPRDPTDRNRTSPFAFTGNKFEVRCVGSSQRPAVSNLILNTISADAFDYLSDTLEKEIKKGTHVDDAIRKVVKETFTKHQRIVFNQNGYDPEWTIEAKKRGLLNFRTTPEILQAVYCDKNVTLFEKQKVMTPAEFKANVTVDYENYIKIAKVEAQSLKSLAQKWIIPAVVKYQLKLLALGSKAPEGLLDTISELCNRANKDSETLKTVSDKLSDIVDLRDAAFFAKDTVLPAQADLRRDLDKLEALVDQEVWPLPTYEEILHEKPNTVTSYYQVPAGDLL